MDEKQKARIRIVDGIEHYAGNFFRERGFDGLRPITLAPSVDPLGPDPGSSIVGIPKINYQGQDLSLVTSMILHKQVALQEGLEKIFVISPNIRLEKPERKATGKHLFEFSQIDFEVAYAKMADVFSLVDDFYGGLTSYLQDWKAGSFQTLRVEPFKFQPPFAKYTTSELAEKYGEDWESSASKDHRQPFWALSHKREFYDAEDPEKPGTYLNYDLVYPLGFGEALSGAEREHEYDRILMRMERDAKEGLKLEAYTDYLKKAKQGFVPSAGAGIGVERLARFLTRSEHVGDVQLFRRVPGEKVEI